MHKLFLTITNFLLFLLFANISFGQLEKKLLPFIHNIPFSNFSSETINQIDKDDSGVFYMATHSGLIETDGINYNKYDSGKLTDLEGLYVQNDSLIYSCGYGGFGKWVRSKAGTFEYEPIYYKEPSLADYTQPVFLNVLPYKDKIVFHAHNQLYFFDPIENTFHIDQAPDFFGKIFLVNDSLFIGGYNGDVYRYENDTFTLELSTGLDTANIVYFDSFREDKMLLITENGMLWTVGNKGLVLEKTLQNTKINYAIREESGQILLGTERQGIMYVNDEFELLTVLNSDSGLSSSSVQSLFYDQNNVWAITDLGIDILLDSMVSVLTEGNYLGTSYDYHLSGNMLLKATDKGLFKMDLSSSTSIFTLIPGSEGVNWDIDEIDGSIFVGHERGIFTYTNDQFELIHSALGVWNFKQHPRQRDLIFCGTYNGILILKRKGKKWHFYKRLDGFWDSSRFMEFDKSYLWVAHPAKGFFLMALSANFEQIESFAFYDYFKTDEKKYYSYFFKINEELIFYDSGSFYKYEYSDKLFYESKRYNSIFSKLENFESFTTHKNDILFSASGRLGILNDSDSIAKIDFASFGSKLVEPKGDFSKLSNIEDKFYIVSTKDKTLVYDIKKERQNQNNSNYVPKPIVNKVYNKGMSHNTLLDWNNSGQQKISFESNTIELDFFIPNFIYTPHHVVEWKFKSDSLWNILPKENKITLSSLTTDAYNIQIRTNDLQGNHSKELMYSFKVLPVWYFSATAIFIYFILIALGFYVIIYVKNINTEKKLLEIKREKLKLKVENKSNELAFQAYTNIQKNKLLSRLKEYIFNSNKTDKKEDLPSNVREIVNKIERQFKESNDWVKFDYHFKKANPDFHKNLNKLHPDLNANDKRICALIKMQMPTKQMAEFLGINVKSLEMTRYRLRKKLALKGRSDLNQYLNSL